MNRVHEQCPKINSGTVMSQTGSKTESGAQNTQPGPAEHTQACIGAPRCAQWQYRGPWLGRVADRAGRVAARAGHVAARAGRVATCMVVSVCHRPRDRTPRAPAPTPQHPSACLCTLRAQPRAQRPCPASCRGLAGRVAALCPDTVQQPCCLSHDTKFCIVTLYLLPCLRYNFVYCNTPAAH